MPRLHPSLYEDVVRQLPKNLESCSKCDAVATWHYMPWDSGIPRDRFFCDEHVPRGCSCTDHLSDHDGRALPCIEYDHCDDGYRRSSPQAA